FTYFLVPAEYQRRVLLYGVLGAIVFRLLMILGGVWLVSQLHWILYVFGLFLVFTGAKMFFPEKEQKDLEKNPVLRWSRRFLRVTKEFHNEKFFIKKDTLYYVTPLFLVLILVEVSDLVFALDSIPAIFAVTNDVFIIFTSNIFAILGLRALYFLLVNAAERFHFLKYGIAVMLIFIGLKMLIESWIDIPILLALGILVLILGGTVMLSLLLPPKVSAGKK
ncbi:MAG TPA: TerC/Alx family metal homeostasis membrane protein, partial [Gammaproteobacteria bacterium]|nr:TerC/Alx family metal homeostasis membrane protein [Gammaproteobacteria bacterium]